MNTKRTILLLFIGVSLLQAAVPLYMAWHWENVLKTGHQFFWQTAPVDPYDAFKGRYVELRFKENTGPLMDKLEPALGQSMYAIIAENAAGRAYISEVSASRPAVGDYVKVKVYKEGDNQVRVILPFTRYYLPEDLAPAAEAAYREAAGRQTGLAAVRIKDGYGVVEQLYIGDKTLDSLLRPQPGW